MKPKSKKLLLSKEIEIYSDISRASPGSITPVTAALAEASAHYVLQWRRLGPQMAPPGIPPRITAVMSSSTVYAPQYSFLGVYPQKLQWRCLGLLRAFNSRPPQRRIYCLLEKHLPVHTRRLPVASGRRSATPSVQNSRWLLSFRSQRPNTWPRWPITPL